MKPTEKHTEKAKEPVKIHTAEPTKVYTLPELAARMTAIEDLVRGFYARLGSVEGQLTAIHGGTEPSKP